MIIVNKKRKGGKLDVCGRAGEKKGGEKKLGVKQSPNVTEFLATKGNPDQREKRRREGGQMAVEKVENEPRTQKSSGGLGGGK